MTADQDPPRAVTGVDMSNGEDRTGISVLGVRRTREMVERWLLAGSGEATDSNVAVASAAQCRPRRSRQDRSDRARGAARVQSRVTGEPIRFVGERKPGVRLGSTRGVTVKISDSIDFANGVRVNMKSTRKVRGAGVGNVIDDEWIERPA